MLQALDGRFDEIYDGDGRKSIPPERLLRALLLQLLYSVRSERMLMEQLEYSQFHFRLGLIVTYSNSNQPYWMKRGRRSTGHQRNRGTIEAVGLGT